MPPRRTLIGRLRHLSVARQLFALHLCLIVIAVSAAALLAFVHVRDESVAQARRVVLAVARTLAHSPDAVQALRQRQPSSVLESLTESVQQANSVNYVGVLSPEGIRYTHPDPNQIGHPLPDDLTVAAHGHEMLQTYQGRLGPSVRAVVPVVDGGRVIGLVSAVLTQKLIGPQWRHHVPGLLLVTVVALVIAALGAFFVSQRLKRQTLGLGPAEITRVYEHHDAVLHAMSQGLLILDTDRRLVLANDEARRLLDLRSAPEGCPAEDVAVTEPLRELLVSGRTAGDELHLTDERVLVVSQHPAHRDGRDLGTVTVLRDHTELQALTGELDSMRGFAESLRAQAHEAANRLHTVVTLIEVGQPDKAIEFATAELASAQQLTDRLLGTIDDQPVAALLLGKSAAAHEKGVRLVVTDDSALTSVRVDTHDLITLIGNLVDNAVDAALAAPPPRRVAVTIRNDDDTVLLRVADSGAGLDPITARKAFVRGWSTKAAEHGHGRGLGLALVGQVVRRYHGSIEVTQADGAVFTVRLTQPGPPAHQPEVS